MVQLTWGGGVDEQVTGDCLKKKPDCFTKRNQSDTALSNLLLLLQTL